MSKTKKQIDDWAHESALAGGVCCLIGWFVFGLLCSILAVIFGTNAVKSSRTPIQVIGIIEILVGVLMALILLANFTI